jgi:hypothetical protein
MLNFKTNNRAWNDKVKCVLPLNLRCLIMVKVFCFTLNSINKIIEFEIYFLTKLVSLFLDFSVNCYEFYKAEKIFTWNNKYPLHISPCTLQLTPWKEDAGSNPAQGHGRRWGSSCPAKFRPVRSPAVRGKERGSTRRAKATCGWSRRGSRRSEEGYPRWAEPVAGGARRRGSSGVRGRGGTS